MSTFLLIHGGSHGAWCWESLREKLSLKGHEVRALDLPGHGQDRTPRQDINRQTYINSVLNYLENEDLKDVTIVGHSLAGTILPELWENAQERVSSLVFLAALVLRAGEAPIDLIPEDRRLSYYEMASRSADNSFILSFEIARIAFFNDLSEDDARGFYSQLTPQPLGVYLDRRIQTPKLPSDRVRYILCADDKALPRGLCESCAAVLGVQREEISSGHDAMLSRPQELGDLLTKKTI